MKEKKKTVNLEFYTQRKYFSKMEAKWRVFWMYKRQKTSLPVCIIRNVKGNPSGRRKMIPAGVLDPLSEEEHSE